MYRKLLAFLMSLVLTLSVAPTLIIAESNTDRTILYVATDGKDSNDGSKDRPFATIEHARDTIRQMKKDGRIGSKGAVVYLRGGTYSQTKSVVFTEEDSGTEGAPIVYRGYPGEDVKILGGASLPLKEIEKVTDEAILAKLINQSARENLYRISFKKAGIDSDAALLYLVQSYGTIGSAIGEFRQDLVHYGEELKEYYKLPKTRSTPIKVMADDTDMESARYPDKGLMKIEKPGTQYSTINGVEEMQKYGITTTGNADLAEIRYKEMLSGNQPRYPDFLPDDAEHTKLWAGRDLKNVLFSGNVAVGWSTEILLLREVKPDGTIVSQNATYWWPTKKGDSFYIYNFFDEISENEFYFDMDKDYMYLCLPKAPTKYNDISISLLETPIFDIKNVSYMDIKNIHFSFSAGETLKIVDSNYVVVDDCEISHTMKRNSAATITGNSYRCGITNSYFHDVNGGVTLSCSTGIDGQRLDKRYSYFVNNEMEEFNAIDKTQAVALHVEGSGNFAMFNEFHGGDHQCLLFGGYRNVIAFNEAYDVCRNTDDAAVLYAGQSWVPRGCLIGYNYFHGIGASTGGSNLGINGIYLDDGFSNADVVGNVLEGVPNYGIFLGGGNGNGIYNNVVINSGGGIWCDERCYDKTATPYEGRVDNYYRYGNIFSAEDFKEIFPDLENLDFDWMRIPANFYKQNVIYNSGGITTTTQATKYGTFEDNYITNDDPGFADLANRDYTLDENSSAAKKISNFMPIPFTRMGRCVDRANERIKPATVLAIDSPKAIVNGTEVTIDEDESIVPMVINDSTYLPLRFLAEANGFTVSYNAEDKTASFVNDETTATVNTATGEVVINGEKAAETIDVVLKNNRTYLPMRKLSEMLGKYVFWDKSGLIAVSSVENLFNSENDIELIIYINSLLDIY